MTSMPMNVCAKPEPGIVTKGQLKPVAIALDSIVLPVPGAPRNSRPRSRLPPARSNASPDCHSEIDAARPPPWPRPGRARRRAYAPVGVARLVALDLPEADDQQRAEQDQDVDQEEASAAGPRGPAVAAPPWRCCCRCPDRRSHALAVDERDGPDDQQEDRAEDGQPAELLAPVPRPPARDHVFLEELRVDVVEVRPGDQPARDDVDQASERHHRAEAAEQRPRERPVVALPEQQEERGCGEDRDDRGRAAKGAPLLGEGRRTVAMRVPRSLA